VTPNKSPIRNKTPTRISKNAKYSTNPNNNQFQKNPQSVKMGFTNNNNLGNNPLIKTQSNRKTKPTTGLF